jgi:hypothetical protein
MENERDYRSAANPSLLLGNPLFWRTHTMDVGGQPHSWICGHGLGDHSHTLLCGNNFPIGCAPPGPIQDATWQIDLLPR